jgi:hypothetical protein
MAILGVELLFGSLDELLIQVIAYQVDGAATEAAAHDTGTGNAAFLGDIVQKVEFLTRNLVVF